MRAGLRGHSCPAAGRRLVGTRGSRATRVCSDPSESCDHDPYSHLQDRTVETLIQVGVAGLMLLAL